MDIKEKYSDFYLLVKYVGIPIELLHEMSEVEITMYTKEIKLKLNK